MKMIRTLLYIFTFSLFFACNSQNEVQKLNDINYEILNIFLNQFDSSYYLDRNIYGDSLPEHFLSRYKSVLRIYTSAKSFCKTKEDTTSKKFYCDLAYSKAYLDGLFSDLDMKFIADNYNYNMNYVLDFSKVQNVNIKPHSNVYYDKVYQQKYSIVEGFDEFPSIRLFGFYLNDAMDRAIFTYSITRGYDSSNKRFAILRKNENRDWKFVTFL